MVSDRFDITLDGNKFRIFRTEDGSGYQKRFERQQVMEQLVRQSTRQVLSSRPDRSLVYQNDWSDGSAWWKPLMSPANSAMYHTSSRMDAFTKPGVVLPTNRGVAAGLPLTANTPLFSDGADLFAVGATTTQDANILDLMRWAGDEFGVVTGASSGSKASAPELFGVAHSPVDKEFYVLGVDYISKFNDNLSSLAVVWFHITDHSAVPSKAGDSMFISIQGRLFIYNGGIIRAVDKATPTLEVTVDDGFGPDILAGLKSPASPRIPASAITLAVAHSSGIFYAKNVVADGQPVCHLSRVDRDPSGAHLRSPLTTLPAGLVCLNITVHLGSIIMACTRDWRLLIENDRTVGETPVIEFYAYTQGSGLSVIGSPLRERPTEMPARFLASDNEFLYIGSGSRIWVYDGARGGIHPWLIPPVQTGGLYEGLAPAARGDGTQTLVLKRGAAATIFSSHAEDPLTVGALGTDLTTYVLESNYFDFGLPFEHKNLTGVNVHTEPMAATQRWTVQVSADDGAFTTVATFSNGSYFEQGFNAISGRRFRYRIIYETTVSSLRGLQGVQFTATQGVMVPVWDLVLNGREIINAENQVMDPEIVFSQLETTAQKQQPVMLLDNFRSQRASDTSTHTVLIDSLRFIKSDPNESLISVSLVGAG